MTDSSIIQDARDVLAKWREDAESKGQWTFDDLGGMTWTVWGVGTDPLDSAAVHADSGLDARLIVGTAGNPDLLDVVDDILREGQEALAEIEASGSHALMQLVNATGGGRSRNAVRLATAIVAANERMSA